MNPLVKYSCSLNVFEGTGCCFTYPIIQFCTCYSDKEVNGMINDLHKLISDDYNIRSDDIYISHTNHDIEIIDKKHIYSLEKLGLLKCNGLCKMMYKSIESGKSEITILDDKNDSSETFIEITKDIDKLFKEYDD